jgi:hypothetical protein
MAAMAAWWLGTTRVLAEEKEAAAKPTRTMERPRTRIASFIISNLPE